MSRKTLSIPNFRFNHATFITCVRIFRWLSFIMYGFAIGWINTHPLAPPFEPQGTFGGSLKFLTYWDLLTQFILFTLINYCDLFLTSSTGTSKHNQKSTVLIKLRDIVHHGLAMPLGLFISIVFWIIYAIDEELIYPLSVRPYYPAWLNHITHTMVGITVLIEEMVFYHRRDNRRAFIALFSYLAVYFVWFLYLGYVINYWSYSVIRLIPDPYKIPFILSFGLVCALLFYLGQYIHTTLWPIPNQKARKEKKR